MAADTLVSLGGRQQGEKAIAVVVVVIYFPMGFAQ